MVPGKRLLASCKGFLLKLLCLCLLGLGNTSLSVYAEGEAEGEGGTPAGTTYLNLDPPFVVNFGGQGRLRYMKADIALRLSSPGAENQIRHHMPHIRNDLILLLSNQTAESLMSSEGKEQIRQEALKTIQEIIETEDGQHGVQDLLFTNFVVQR